jgi:hypothetical protein
MNASEQYVKNIYPNAIVQSDWVNIRLKTVYTETSGPEWDYRYLLHIATGNKVLAFGGKFEHLLWRRAWKAIKKEMLEKLEA